MGKSADDKLMIFFFLWDMKCQILFFENSKKNVSKCRLLNFIMLMLFVYSSFKYLEELS